MIKKEIINMKFIYKTSIVNKDPIVYKKVTELLKTRECMPGLALIDHKRTSYDIFLSIINKQAIPITLFNEYIKLSKLIIITQEDDDLRKRIERSTGLKEERIITTTKLEKLINIIDNELTIIAREEFNSLINDKPEKLITENPTLINAIMQDNINTVSLILNQELTIDDLEKIRRAYNLSVKTKKYEILL